METTYGICRLAIVPVRSEAKHSAEQISQLLFGDHYEIIDTTKDGKWLKIQIFFDGYIGWIDKNQHTEIPHEHFELLNHVEYKICTDAVAGILYKKKLINIVIGSILPISSSELFDVHEQFAFNGESKNIGQKSNFEYLKNIALKYRNAPYAWGGKSPFGIDCSGFSQQVFKICGYKLKRDAKDQFLQGDQIENLEKSQPGDLAFFNNESGKITHVGILLENGEIIHASGSVRIDTLDEQGIFSADINKYTHNLKGIKRLL
ncbi:MAG: NlpC/P60 family protein [Cyclobacteriaceae bacterium]